MTFGEAKSALAGKLDVDFSDIANNGLYTEADFAEWLWQGWLRAWSYRMWDFTEGSKQLTLDSNDITSGYIDYPTNLMAGSIFLLRIDSKEYKRRRYEDYLKAFEENSASTVRLWAERKRYIFFNTNVAAAGLVLEGYGKLKPTYPASDAALRPFSDDAGSENYEYSGNDAIVQLAYAAALDSEKKRNPAQAQSVEAKALRILNELWAPFARNKSLDQANRPMFNVPDFMGGGTDADQTGRFNYQN